jgi:hypothetical protein
MLRFLPHIAALVTLCVAAPSGHSTSDSSTPADGAALDKRASVATGAQDLLAISADAEKEGDMDRALWYAKLALGLVVDPKDDKAARTRWLEVRKAVAAPEPDPTATLAAFSKELFNIAKACESRKLYANAADVLNQLKGTAYEREATDKLSKLFSKKQAIELLLESGVPVIVERRQKFSKKEATRLDARHAEWENAYIAEGKNYRIKTNMGVDMAHTMLDAMEQINKFYRKVFHHEERGGSMKACVVNVYKTRAEFDEHEGVSQGIKGFFQPMTNSVTTYDHATEEGFGRDYLWSTLFHEASHQFTHAVWPLQIPTWLNEGTASYFEGALLQPGGFIATNRIPESRLEQLIMMIGEGSEDGRTTTGSEGMPGAPTVREVLEYILPGSYPGAYYPYGWGLVFFCRNYENDKSERVFQPVYEAFMRSYTEGSGERNPFKRFEQYFITEAKIPGVDSFNAFEQLWKSWIRQLGRIYFGGKEQAEVLVARGQKELADGKPEYAVDSFRWATEKDPNHATAWLELGRSARKAKADDAALYAFRRLAALAQRRVDAAAPLPFYKGTAAEAVAAAMTEIKGLEQSIERSVREKLGTIVDTALAAADAHIELGFPITALSLLRDADLLLDGHGKLRARINELVQKHGVDGRLVRQVPIDAELTAWRTEDPEFKAGEDGALVLAGGRGVSTIRLADVPPKVFRFEARIKSSDAMVGLLFDGQELDETYLVVRPGVFCGIVRFDPDFQRMLKRRSWFVPLATFSEGVPPRGVEEFTLAIEVEHSALRVAIDGTVIGSYDVPCEDLIGEIGLIVEGPAAEFRDVRLAY